MSNGKTVYIVDDDLSVRKGLTRLLSELGYEVVAFACAGDFLAWDHVDGPACAVMEVRMPDRTGFDVLEIMRHGGLDISVIFLTAHGDVAQCVRAMKAGAVDFLTKPASRLDLINAIAAAHGRSAERLGARCNQSIARERLSRLTAREREVLALVLEGRRNKQIAAVLASQEATVKVHRSRLMRKLEARSLAELLRFGQQFELHRAAGGHQSPLSGRDGGGIGVAFPPAG